jgi:hypothetical protein
MTVRAVRVDGGWVIESPRHRWRVMLTDLSDIDAEVEAAWRARAGLGHPEAIAVTISEYVHVDDCSPAERYELERFLALSAGARGGQRELRAPAS